MSLLGVLIFGVSPLLALPVTDGAFRASQEAAPTVAQEAADETPRSLLAHPLYLGEEPPPVRACRLILLNYKGAANASVVVSRSKEQSVELAHKVIEQVRAGADMGELAKKVSSSRSTSWSGGIYGTFAPRVLTPPLDEFLFSAELGEVSEPIVLGNGVHILQRIEHEAASRQIMLRKGVPDAIERLKALRARVEAGEDFAELAREHSMDPYTAERGGFLKLVQRTREDRVLRAATFEPPIWGMTDPIESSVGYHLVQRIPLDMMPADLVETRFIRVSAVLVRFEGAVPFDLSDVRSPSQAETIAREVYDRVLAGEDFAELARQMTEDKGSRERSGDLGWLHRHSISVPKFMEQAFYLEVGEMLEPFHTTAGWLVLRRDR